MHKGWSSALLNGTVSAPLQAFDEAQHKLLCKELKHLYTGMWTGLGKPVPIAACPPTPCRAATADAAPDACERCSGGNVQRGTHSAAYLLAQLSSAVASHAHIGVQQSHAHATPASSSTATPR